MEKDIEISSYDILWHKTFSGQYEIKNNIKEPVVNKNIILLDSTFQSISTPIEVSGNTQMLCTKCAFDKCTENEQKANAIHSTCHGLCIKSTVCTDCIQSGNFRSFVITHLKQKTGNL